ncbi:MAG: hemerythrin domain-containing protein [Actinomycetota bacterium]|nr:hemerythrin domain-containing protein [Actinomycetota bacterium]
MDAIRMLKDDHKAVEQLFKRFEKAGDRAYTEKRTVVDRIVEELSTHAAIEEQLFYPVVRATVPDTEDMALESLEEHHIVKRVLSELDKMDPHEERFDAKVTVLIENVRHHVQEEEQEFFPKVRNELGRSALGDLGDAMAAARQVAPTHPHPHSPDSPPVNLVVGTAAGVVDRLGDTVSGVAQGGVTALGDVIAVVLGRKKPAVSPRGTKVARKTAGRVRSGASSVTDSAVDAVSDAKRSARGTAKRAARTARASSSSARAGATSTARKARAGAKSTARAAKSGAKGTATSARRSASNTVTTAKRATTTTGRTARTAAKSTATTAKRATKRTASAAKRTSRPR